ncbi:MAG: SDR family NAD(P)-dependent oxidoreductase [Trueperaceae bacterium]
MTRSNIEQELVTNLYLYELTLRFLLHLLAQKKAGVVNISSGLIYSPAAIAPIYSAAKAGLHTFTQTLRYQLRDKALTVFEVLPPAVDTPLNATVKVDKISVEEIAKAILDGLDKNTEEIRIGQIKMLHLASRIAPSFINRKINESITKASVGI